MRGEKLERDGKRRKVDKTRGIEIHKLVKRQSKDTNRHKNEVREGKLRECKRRGRETVGGKCLEEGLNYWKTMFSQMAEKAKNNKIEVRGAKEHILRIERGRRGQERESNYTLKSMLTETLRGEEPPTNKSTVQTDRNRW